MSNIIFDPDSAGTELVDALEEAERMLATAMLAAVWCGAGYEIVDFIGGLGERVSRAIEITEPYREGEK